MARYPGRGPDGFANRGRYEVVIRPSTAALIVQRGMPRSPTEMCLTRSKTHGHHVDHPLPSNRHQPRSDAMPTHTVILRPSAFSGVPSALVILMTILVLLGVAAHAAVL